MSEFKLAMVLIFIIILVTIILDYWVNSHRASCERDKVKYNCNKEVKIAIAKNQTKDEGRPPS